MWKRLIKFGKEQVNLIWRDGPFKGATYEEKLDELGMLWRQERRHQSDMAQLYQVLLGVDKVEKGSNLRQIAEREPG